MGDPLAEHIKAFWDAEQTNAARLHDRRRLLTGVLTPLIGLGAAVGSLVVLPLPPGGRWVTAAWFGVGTLLIVGSFQQRVRWLSRTSIITGLVSNTLLVVLGLCGVVGREYVAASSIGALFATGCVALVLVTIALYQLLAPYNQTAIGPPPKRVVIRTYPPPSPAAPASAWFRLSASAAKAAFDATSDPVAKLTLSRMYAAADALLEQNDSLRLRLRRASQTIAVAAVLVGLLVVFSIQASVAAPPKTVQLTP